MSSSKALSADQVKIWAETMGIQNLSEDAADFIVSSVNQKMAAIVDRANKSANMSKRMKILKSDVDCAMQLLNLEPTVDSGVADYIPIRGVSGVGGRTLYVHDDKDRELLTVVKKHAGPVPAEVTLRQHWLSVEGKQPTVPENPAPLSKDEQRVKASDPKLARRIATDKAIRKSQMVSIKDLATSDLSAEQQQYYRDITEAVIGSNEDKRREALISLEHDPGLHALVPRLAVFISEGVKINVVQQNLALLIYIMRTVKAMLDNQTLYLQPYLHLIVPAVTSCIVSRMLCSRPEVDNHWALRGFAARILATVSKAYDSPTNRLAQRLIQIFKDSLDDELNANPLSTRYGAYCALTELGNDVISLLVLPRVRHEVEALRICLTTTTNLADKKAAEQIKEKLAQRIAEYYRQVRPTVEKSEDFRTEYGPIMGPLIFEWILKEKIKEKASEKDKGRSGNRPSAQPMQSPQPHAGGLGSPRLAAASPSSAGIAASSPNPYFPRPLTAVRPNTPLHSSAANSYPEPPSSSVPKVLGGNLSAGSSVVSVPSPVHANSPSVVNSSSQDYHNLKRQREDEI